MPHVTAYNSYEENTNNCYESCGQPLYCGAFDMQLHGGINPILWRNLGTFSTINCQIPAPLGPLVKNLDFPKFRQIYRLPWVVGGQIGYGLSENIRIFVEANYIQARGKNSPTFDVQNAFPGQTVALSVEKYRLVDVNVGTRYYFARWCESTSLFLGTKIGLTHHRSVDFNYLSSTPAVITFPAPVPFFLSNTVFSGGVHMGADICFYTDWPLVITFEVVGSCGPQGNANIPLTPDFEPSTNLLLSMIGSEVRFPITAGIRYSF